MQLQAGVARAIITPTGNDAINLSNGRMCPGDPLFARVLVLKGAETSVALVSADLILFASRKVVAEAKARFGEGKAGTR